MGASTYQYGYLPSWGLAADWLWVGSTLPFLSLNIYIDNRDCLLVQTCGSTLFMSRHSKIVNLSGFVYKLDYVFRKLLGGT